MNVFEIFFSPFSPPSKEVANANLKRFRMIHDVIPIMEHGLSKSPKDWYYKIYKDINAEDYYLTNSEQLDDCQLITFGDKKIPVITTINVAKELQAELQCENNEILNEFTTETAYTSTLIRTGEIPRPCRGRQPTLFIRDDHAKQSEPSRFILMPKGMKSLQYHIHKALKNDRPIQKMQDVYSNEIKTIEDVQPFMTIFVTFMKKPRSIYKPVRVPYTNDKGEVEVRKVFGASDAMLSVQKSKDQSGFYEQKNTTNTEIQTSTHKPTHKKFQKADCSIKMQPDTRVTTQGLHPTPMKEGAYTMAK